MTLAETRVDGWRPARFDAELGSYRPADLGLSEPAPSFFVSVLVAVWAVVEAAVVLGSPLVIVVGFCALLGVI